jgi:hypothetical protein
MGKVRGKLDGEPEPPPPPPRPPVNIDYGNRNQGNRYDSDPRVLNDDLNNLNLQDQQRQSHRPLANPDLFKSTRFSNNNTSPPALPARPVEETAAQAQNTPGKKWEALRPAEDRDPFALGDTDDEDELYGTSHPRTGKQETGLVETPLDPAVSGPATQNP